MKNNSTPPRKITDQNIAVSIIIFNKLFHPLLMLSLLLYSSNTFSQSQNWWKTDGNSNGSNTTFLGTTNNFSLRFRANNTEWFSISPSGQYTFNGLSGTGNGLMLISNTDNVYRLNFRGNNNEVLTAAGNWQSISNLLPLVIY